MSSHPVLKQSFPFRLGTTSYIIPDDILPNVRFLAEKVDDIQLILFESADASNLPSRQVVSELASMARDHDLSYTIHFPLDVFLGAPDESVRTASVEMCRRILDLCRPLQPRTMALHFSGDDPDDRGAVPSTDMTRWLGALDASMEALVSEVDSPRSFCVETLAYPIGLVDEVVQKHDLGICLDVGHLLRWGHDVYAHLSRYVDRMHLMHIHGVKGERDHHSLEHLDPAILRRALDTMEPQDRECRVMTVEVFNEDDFTASMRCLDRELERGGTM